VLFAICFYIAWLKLMFLTAFPHFWSKLCFFVCFWLIFIFNWNGLWITPRCQWIMNSVTWWFAVLRRPQNHRNIIVFQFFYRNGKPCLPRLTCFKTSGVLEHSVYFIMVGVYTVGVTAYRCGFVSMHKLRVATNWTGGCRHLANWRSTKLIHSSADAAAAAVVGLATRVMP